MKDGVTTAYIRRSRQRRLEWHRPKKPEPSSFRFGLFAFAICNPFHEDAVYWSKRVQLPYKPHIGSTTIRNSLPNPRVESERTHGAPAGNRQRGRVRREPGGKFRERDKF